ncbi:unnamed protein product [Paramecium octaurelia]|uniref:Transmembrane protein n=1 Tax=Paramecium octaurelia TaxID=43137 RepID=A0A8S1YN66_PAROT|nr:unnamed protein product [Paramecium octaurelia]
MKFLKKADFFGVPFVQNIDHQQAKYQSVTGGILTITICILSLSYTFWVGYLWKSNQMNPKISREHYVSDYSLLDLNYNFGKDYDNKIDPFANNILLPLVVYAKNNTLTDAKIIENHINTTLGDFYVPDMKLGFSYYNGYIYTSNEMYIEIVLCSDEYLKPGEKCASPELTEEFFAQANNLIIVEFYSTTVDPRDGSKQRGYQEYYMQIEQNYCYLVNTFFKTNLFELQNYFLFGTSDYKEYIVDAQIQTQTSSFEYCQKVFQNDVIAVLYLGMKGTQEKMILEYPRLGDLLANIGSIVSILFMLKYIIMFINQHYLNQKILNELISYYYPEFKKIQISKNWRGIIVQVRLNQFEIDARRYIKFYDKVSKQMRQKFSYLNLLYEISRLYFVIRSSKFRNEFSKSHQIGIKINIPQYKDSETLVSQKSEKIFENNCILNEDDAEILSQARSKIDKNFDLISEELYNEVDYYYLNKIQ